MKNEKEFLLELATLLEKHRVAICSRRTGEWSEVLFQRVEVQPFKQVNIETGRLHVSSYDLRCKAGMSSQEANDMWRLHMKLRGES